MLYNKNILEISFISPFRPDVNTHLNMSPSVTMLSKMILVVQRISQNRPVSATKPPTISKKRSLFIYPYADI